jgi:hypothetical protein
MGFRLIDEPMDRRTFICRASVAGLAAAGVMLGLTACGGGKKEESAPGASATASRPVADPCNDLTGLTQDELATRTTFKYEAKASDPAKVCTTCNFYHKPVGDSPCGTCTLVKGPIEPGGGCVSWVAIQKS